MIRLVLAALCCVVLSGNAEARHRQFQPSCIETGSPMFPACMGNDFLAGVKSISVTMKRDRHSRVKPGNQAEVVGGRPAGCPHAFCGCGASLHLFGRIIPSLNLAANWLRFPRAMPAPKMAAVRRHHVFVLEQQIHGDIWLAYDANSGGHAIRLHPRSIAGYVIVNPHA